MNPYQNLPDKAFWRKAIADVNPLDISNLWKPKFNVGSEDRVVAFGSCFAQHFGKALNRRGFNWFISEPAPAGLNDDMLKKFNYDVFSCRTGNIYTTSLLKQWTEWALEIRDIPMESWESNGRYYDPFRPNIEPNGFASLDEMYASRRQTITSFKSAITKCNVFVFTLGLTESWFNSGYGYEYPMCPGTVAGDYDEKKHLFKNQSVGDVQKNLNETLDIIRKVNPNIKVLLTVSPVPLTATNSGNHVLVSTIESKSILRAVAAQVSKRRGFVDYFPSFEIISSFPYRGMFFEPNMRNVNQRGVNHVMDIFFAALGVEVKQKIRTNESQDDVVCEEELLGAFGGGER